MLRSLAFLLLGLTAWGAAAHEVPPTRNPPQHVPLNQQPLLVPLYESFDPNYLDYFYTVDASQHAIAQSIGYIATGEPVAYLERTQQPGTKPFYRFYKDHPEYNH